MANSIAALFLQSETQTLDQVAMLNRNCFGKSQASAPSSISRKLVSALVLPGELSTMVIGDVESGS